MYRFLLAILMLGIVYATDAVARPAIDIAESLRLDGAGPRAWTRFRTAETRCGIIRDGSDDTRIYNTFESAILTLDFGGTRRRILPLLVTDKPGDDHILKIKVRTPCVTSVKREGGTYLIGVTTRIDPPGTRATLRVDAEGRLLNLAQNAGLFYVVGENSRGYRPIDRFALIRSRLGRFTCRLGETEQECEYQFLNYAERVFSDEIRHQAFWPDPDRRRHHDRLQAAIAARVKDSLTLALHRLIIANESATISPFQVWDAVLADSGMSFGPHQWDIGINPEAQRIFRAFLKAAGGKPAIRAPDRYLKSVRRFSTRELKEFLLAVPALDRALRSPAGQRTIVSEYVKWLETEALSRARAALPGLDPANPLHQAMLLYYVDVDNQYGAEDVKQSLRRAIGVLASANAPLPEARSTLDALMMATPFARAWPDKAAARLERTWNILGELKP